MLCLVFDLTSDASFRNCGHWLERVRTHSQGQQVPGKLDEKGWDIGWRRGGGLCPAAGGGGSRPTDGHVHLYHAGVLVGNKSDLSSRREVEKAVAQNWAQSQGLEYHETSAVSLHALPHVRRLSCPLWQQR